MDDWRELVKQKRFAEAEPLMMAATDPDKDKTGDGMFDRGQFYEAWGDATRDPIEATDHYNQADYFFSIYASWSTSGGEGTARMRDVDRVRTKTRNVKREL